MNGHDGEFIIRMKDHHGRTAQHSAKDCRTLGRVPDLAGT
jgi:hypothetical protein